jgi:L-ribulose-5-phosphate 3-epimerase
MNLQESRLVFFSERIGFMQGRLSELIDDKIQAFPEETWANEFALANENGFRLMEWTIDAHNLHKNPLFLIDGRDKINNLIKKCKVRVNSITADCFMQDPPWKRCDEKNTKVLYADLVNYCSEVGINIIVLPLVDNSSLKNSDDEQRLIEFLRPLEQILIESGIKIAFESDYAPKKMKRFIGKFPENIYGVNYDIGNSAALGHDSGEEFEMYGLRIFNIHIKDRLLNGPTVPLGSGNANFKKVLDGIKQLNYEGNFIMQTARANYGQHCKVMRKYFEWMQSSYF